MTPRPSAPRARLRTGTRKGRLLPVIGITGGIGSGKTAVASLFRKWGGVVVSGDRIGHDIVDSSPRVRRRLIAAFGTDIESRGQIRRDRLAALAFNSRESLQRLNRIVHPPLIRELNRQVAQARRSQRHQAVVIDAALLTEWGIGRVRWDCLVGVWAPAAERRERARRKGWTDAQFRERSRWQMPWSERRRLVDCIVKNDSSLSVLQGRARLCWMKLLS
ncbi:MAG: dephospho-CoA kinase [Candidatus Zixiibacteriota bacterium]